MNAAHQLRRSVPVLGHARQHLVRVVAHKDALERSLRPIEAKIAQQVEQLLAQLETGIKAHNHQIVSAA
jgi:hypothetical protein